MKTAPFLLCALLLTACSSTPSPESAAAAPAAPALVPITTKSPEALAHYQKGEALFENARAAEGVEEFKQALQADPGFVSAKALHGFGTPGPEGLQELEAAAAAAGSLPEAERLVIEGLLAERRGELDKAASAFTRVTELAPGDYLGFLLLGQQRMTEQKYVEAQQALKQATALNPTNGGAQNQLGYASLQQGDTAAAIAAFEQYTRVSPQEPNAQDSLGEALLAAGRFKEAEAAFSKALELAPQFWSAHQGIAYTKFYSGDWSGGRAALAKAKEIAPRPTDKLSVDNDMVAAAAAQRDFPQAFRLIDGMEKATGVSPAALAAVPVLRALAQVDAGRARQALTTVASAVAAADSGKYPPGPTVRLLRDALRVRAMAESQLGDTAAAQKTSAALDAAAMARPTDALAQSAMHFGRAMLGVAERDLKRALAEFSQCSPEDRLCAWHAVIAANKVGDKEGADAARARALKIYGRDSASLVVRSRLDSPGVS